jgi:hypothetical protein
MAITKSEHQQLQADAARLARQAVALVDRAPLGSVARVEALDIWRAADQLERAIKRVVAVAPDPEPAERVSTRGFDTPPFAKGERVRVNPQAAPDASFLTKHYAGREGTVVGYFWEMAGVGPVSRAGARKRRYLGARVRFEKTAANIHFVHLERAE